MAIYKRCNLCKNLTPQQETTATDMRAADCRDQVLSAKVAFMEPCERITLGLLRQLNVSDINSLLGESHIAIVAADC